MQPRSNLLGVGLEFGSGPKVCLGFLQALVGVCTKVASWPMAQAMEDPMNAMQLTCTKGIMSEVRYKLLHNVHEGQPLCRQQGKDWNP